MFLILANFNLFEFSVAISGKGLLSISEKIHKFIIYAMRQRARADNLTICYFKKPADVSFSFFCPITDNEFRHNIVKISQRIDQLGSFPFVDPQLL